MRLYAVLFTASTVEEDDVIPVLFHAFIFYISIVFQSFVCTATGFSQPILSSTHITEVTRIIIGFSVGSVGTNTLLRSTSHAIAALQK